jgi:hypothetical protein
VIGYGVCVYWIPACAADDKHWFASPFGERLSRSFLAGEGGLAVPTISWFYGIAIRMYFLDHPPPHFEAVYNEHEANVSIEAGGHLPATAARMVKQWTLAHQAELKANWDRARAKMALERIVGLDAD